MRQVWCLTVLSVLIGSGVATAQTPGIVYEWAGAHAEDPSLTKLWKAWGITVPGTGTNSATISAATGDLVVTETGTGLPGGGVVGGTMWIFDDWNTPRENAPDKGNLDVTGLEYLEIDLKHNSPAGTVNVDFMLHTLELESVNVFSGPAWSVGNSLTTMRFPLNLLTPRQQASIKAIFVLPQAHTALGNVTWTISEVRTLGAPLTARDVVTNNLGSPDEGLDGAFPMNTADMLAIVSNPGSVSQLGLSRNPSGSGSLQWTDQGGTGAEGDESGASIGWGNGHGWRNAQAQGVTDPTSGNSYNERIADFSNYDRMTVTISALDAVNLAGTVGIEGVFLLTDDDPVPPPTILASQNLTTDGQYHELVYDLSSVLFLQNVLNWGLDVAPHPNDIAFNIDNIQLWNSTTPTGVPGDYNEDNKVDAADYVVWRKYNGGGTALPNDNRLGTPISSAHYDLWRTNFGSSIPGSGSGASAAVPEPSAAMLLLTAMVGLWWKRRGV
jgi:hypothetical protein